MSANTTSLARWTDEEHQILVQLTNDQLELESQDPSLEISWAAHWRSVSVQLQESGYSRTNTACQSYWKRVVETQKANEEAAGPRWDDSEHEILLGMTEDQLALEKEDHSAVIPWPKHWKKVSLRLQESGYHRTANSCAAYWLKVGYDFSVDTHEPPPESPMSPDDDDDSRGEVEHENPYQDEREFETADRHHDEQDSGSEHTPISADESASSSPQAEEAQPEGFPEPKTILLSNATSVFTPTITPVPSEKDYSEDESYQPRQREPTKSKMAQTPTKAESTPEKPRSPKVTLKRGFRFTAEQKKVLEAQAMRENGCYPDGDRRMELAEELGVDEKTVRNWFVHRRSQKGQLLLANMGTPGTSGHDDSFVSESSPAVPPRSVSKRKSLPVDSRDMPGSDDADAHISKKPQLMNLSRPNTSDVTGSQLNPLPLTSSRKLSVPGSVALQESAAISESPTSPANITAATPNVTAKSPDPPISNPQQPRPRIRAEEHQQDFKRSPSFPSSVAGADWNPINSANSRDPKPVVPASAASTPVPASYVLLSSRSLQNQHPYGKPVSATPPSLSMNVPQSASASPLPRPVAGLSEIDERQWMLSKASTLQFEVENLKRDEAAWLHRLSLVDERINEVTHEENNFEESKRRDIDAAIREIEERYKGRNEYIKIQQSELIRQRDVELAGLYKNRVDGKKKTTALKLFHDLVGLLEED